jgi:hypothetical protein
MQGYAPICSESGTSGEKCLKFAGWFEMVQHAFGQACSAPKFRRNRPALLMPKTKARCKPVPSAPDGSLLLEVNLRTSRQLLPKEGELRAALERTPCPMAHTATGRFLVPPETGVAQHWTEFLQQLNDALDRSASSLDFIAAALPLRAERMSIKALAAAVHAVFLHLTTPLTLYAEIETTSWTLRTSSGDYFPILMSASYEHAHPRYLDWPAPVLLLQPELSFARRGISSSWAKREELSLAVERRFRDLGREYFGDITRSLPKSLRVIKPLSPDDSPVRWWQFKPAFPQR